MNKIPRMFCVSLRETPQRTKAFQDMANSFGLNVEIFYGLLGQRLQLKPTLTNELECPGRNNYISENAVACFLSHYVLWNVLKYLPEDEFLIFEDDAVFCDDFIKRFEQTYDRLPADWQMVYVGWVPYGKDKSPIPVDEGINIRTPSATHAYLIRKSALNCLCDCMLPMQSPLDLTIIHKCLPLLKYYVFDPPLAIQRTYGNIKDPMWTSLIYDWKSDLYGYKRRMFRDLNLGDGWHNLEKDSQSCWRWSKDKFTIQLPTCLEKITIHCDVTIENSLSVIRGNIKTEHPLSIGNNQIEIETNSNPMLECEVSTPFVPAKKDETSSDHRVLGICLTQINLSVGTTQITLGVSEL